MKTGSDPRHKKRRRVVRELFASSFNLNQEFSKKTLRVLRKKNKIDPLIAKTAPEWPLEKLNKIDFAILRLAVYELTIEKKEPVKVVIDEAVELAKELGGESSPSFVNGVLGTIVKDMNLAPIKGEDETTKLSIGERVRGVIAQSLGLEPSDVENSATLGQDLNLEPSTLTEIASGVNKIVGKEISGEDIGKAQTVGELIALAEQYSQEES